jgi:hypothetical protein
LKAAGTFELKSWQEETYEQLPGGVKLTRAEVSQSFDGDITGKGTVQWLMVYRPDGTAHFVGLQRIDGQVGDRRGTIVLETSGDFDGQLARWGAEIVPGAATGDLEGITGRGRFGAPQGPRATFEFDFRLA